MKMEFLMPRSRRSSILFIILFTLLINGDLKAQDCATPDIPIEEMQKLPWFGNPDYLPSFMDSLNQAETPSQGNNISSIVPNIK